MYVIILTNSFVMESLPYMLPTKLGSFGQAVSEEKIFVGIDQLLKALYKDCSFWIL
jgi:hypothetical protein